MLNIDDSLKVLLENQIDAIKYRFDINVQVDIREEDVFIMTSSLEVSNTPEYESMIGSFISQYDELRVFNVFWGVNTAIQQDDVSFLDDYVHAGSGFLEDTIVCTKGIIDSEIINSSTVSTHEDDTDILSSFETDASLLDEAFNMSLRNFHRSRSRTTASLNSVTPQSLAA